MKWGSCFALSAALVVFSLPVRAQDDLGDIEAASEIDIDPGQIESIDDSNVDSDEIADDPTVDASDVIDPSDVEATIMVDQAVRSASRRQPRRVLELLTSGDAKTRTSAARAIGTERNILGIGSLITALKDRDPSVRRAAAGSLARIGSFDALGALKAAQANETDPPTSRAMDKAIGAIEDRVFAGTGGGEPVTLVCHSCGKKFCLLRRTQTGYCPYDGTVWTLRK